MRNMKKFVAALLVLTMVVALASTAFAYKEKEIFKGVTFKKSAWGYGKVTNNYGKNKSGVALKKGSYAYVVAEKGDWYKIAIPPRGKGEEEFLWFNKKYIRDYKDGDLGVYVFSSGGSGRLFNGEEMEEKSIKGMTVKTTGKVNLRKGPGLEKKSLGTVKKGKKVTLTGKFGYDSRGILFLQVKSSGKVGYISTIYVADADFKKVDKKLAGE